MTVHITRPSNEAIQFSVSNGDVYIGINGYLYFFQYKGTTHRVAQEWDLYLLSKKGVDNKVIEMMKECIN